LAVCIIFHGSTDFDVLEVLPVSGGESLCYVLRGGSPFRRGISPESLCIESISGRMCMVSLDILWAGCPCALCYVTVLLLFTVSVWSCVSLCCCLQ